ncbi:hypothetical protein [Mycolicibacterium sphagni]|uniref:Uncharacterized protein n=1 Tax=Mycolicibacterium sphagni TaxID=1786 RepID=A0ABX2JZ60_9MYCO|nr:hypothetical protein [Mycolicibacterium sphagni]NTY62187.1 hypothetical protein [Mycolicibacterium sphagni]
MPTDITIPKTSALVIRTAAVRSQCRCAKPLLGYRVDFLTGDIVTDTSPEPLPTREDAAGWAVAKVARSYTGMRIVPEPNLDYRPDCLSAILPGDRYVEDTRGDRDGDRYCLRCGIGRAATTGEM